MMKLIRDPKKLTVIFEKLRARGKSIGFVPTMGALHDGHLSLVRASKRENDFTVVSIFVNPTQFGPQEDYTKYPRVPGADRRKLRRVGADYLFCPSTAAMYPEGFNRLLKIAGAKWPRLARGFCAKFRPGHFQGVVTVVAKLLWITGPCRLYLGAKDCQQVAVLGQLIRDLSLDVRVRVMPTVRERDGLAMSSRNRYLSGEERPRALTISRTLFRLRRDLQRNAGAVASLRARALRELKKNVDRVQYLEVVDAETLRPARARSRKRIALAACFVGKTRLIDNVIIPPSRIL